jgi:hypothetical protein
VTVEASPKAGARVRVRSSNGRLTIDTHEGDRGINLLGGSRPPTVTVYFRQLEELELSGAVKVRGDALRADRLRVDASGAATVEIDQLQVSSLVFDASGAIKAELAGTATDQETSISGAAVYRAGRLKSQSTSISVSGAGKAIVNAERKLDAKITGAGAVEYFGDPAVTQRVSGAGKITRRTSASVEPARMRASAQALCPFAAGSS